MAERSELLTTHRDEDQLPLALKDHWGRPLT
jgi:hypothetical protein